MFSLFSVLLLLSAIPQTHLCQSNAAKKIIPLLDRVLVRRIKPIEKTASGIYIPEKAQSNLNRGVVLSVGPGLVDKVRHRPFKLSSHD